MSRKEFEFLNIINNTLKSPYLGDDCAYLEDFNLVLSSDCLIEDIHFKQSYMTPQEIARKALLVNISDILASGAKPRFVSITLAGKLNSSFICDFYKEVKKTTQEFDIEVIGGDLSNASKLCISITILGQTKNRRISSRKNACNNYIVAATGEFGSSAQGLFDLSKGINNNYYINYHKNPPLYPLISEQIAKTTKHPYAMMDSSDGLCDCLYQISTQSKVRIEVEYDRIPKKTDNKDFVLFGGEDYSLVVCLDESDYKNIQGLEKIGVCSIGSGVYVDKKELCYNGFNHFN